MGMRIGRLGVLQGFGVLGLSRGQGLNIEGNCGVDGCCRIVASNGGAIGMWRSGGVQRGPHQARWRVQGSGFGVSEMAGRIAAASAEQIGFECWDWMWGEAGAIWMGAWCGFICAWGVDAERGFGAGNREPSLVWGPARETSQRRWQGQAES